MSLTYGIPNDAWQQIMHIFPQYEEITSVALFGSRAKGNAGPASDIDLCLYGNVDSKYIPAIQETYYQLYLPWKLDLVLDCTLKHAELRAHIERVGITVYTKGCGTHRATGKR